jgi:hypothetical protein
VFDQGGLSLDQAPPISVILGLFAVGGMFGVLSGISVLFYGDTIFDPSSVGAVVTVHMLSLGVMMSFMLGALFQMLPVVAGIALESPIPKANLAKVLLILGVSFLIGGFVTNSELLFIFASISLGALLLYVVALMTSRLVSISSHGASSRGILFALFSMGIFVSLALYLTTTYAQLHDGAYFLQVKQAHYSYALFGWIGLLIMSISFQTVEMFYVTPAYPIWMSRYAPIVIFALLMLLSILISIESNLSIVISLLIYLLFIVYGGYTLKRLSQRKRPLTDATVWFWRIGMVSLISSMVLLTVQVFVNQIIILDIAIVLFVSFVFSVLFAMFYKIVPFLIWFHLNAQGYLNAPMMHEVIHPRTAKKHMWLHLVSVIYFLVAAFVPQIIYLGGLLLVASFGWIAYQVAHSQRLYDLVQKTGEKFELPMYKN